MAKKEALEAGLYPSYAEFEWYNYSYEEQEQIKEALGRMKIQFKPSQGQRVWSEHYTYDNNSNRLTKTTKYGTINYTYDDENRLRYSGKENLVNLEAEIGGRITFAENGEIYYAATSDSVAYNATSLKGTRYITTQEDGSTYYFGKLSSSSIGMSIKPKIIPYKSIDISTDRGSLFILIDNNELLSTSNGESFKKIASNVTKISGNLFIKEDSSLFAFGNVTTGSLGVTVKSQDVPQFVMKDVKDVIFNYWHSIIIQNDGSLYSCGGIFGKPNSTTYSYMGFLGDGSGKPQHTPVKIAENVIWGAISDFTTFFITEDGSLWRCGLNNYDETVLYM